MNNPKWTLFAVGYQCVFAYTIALMVYQFGLAFTGGGFRAGTAAALVVLAVYLWLLFRKGYRGEGERLRAVDAVHA